MSELESIAEIMQRASQKRPHLHLVSSQPMSNSDILRWGERHNWPKLVLAEGTLRPGRDAWEELIASNDYARLVGVSQRIEKWNKLEQQR